MTAMDAQPLSQFGLFDAELADVRELLRDREEAFHGCKMNYPPLSA